MVNQGRFTGSTTQGDSCKITPRQYISHLLYLGDVTYQWEVKDDNVTLYGNTVFHIKEERRSEYNFGYKLGARGMDLQLRTFIEEAIKGKVKEHEEKEGASFKVTDNVGMIKDLNNHFNEYGVEFVSFDVEGFDIEGVDVGGIDTDKQNEDQILPTDKVTYQ